MRAITFLLFVLLSTYITSKTKDEWKTRSIYQILTDRFARTSDTGSCTLSQYCGGNYQGIINHLDYIQGMGFNAIWISPIVQNYAGSYHGYHLTNLYNLNSNFGSEDDFKNLITQCHNRDIWVMVDVVANHVGPGLPDLKQENEWVAQTLLDWISDIISKYNIDGIRIDTIMEVPKTFWDSFRNYAGVFQIGEAFNGDINYVADYQNHLDSVFNYPLYYTIQSSFCGSFTNLEGYWFNSRPIYPAPQYAATFVENHDNPRFLNRCNDRSKFTNAAIFSLLWEGIPVFYYGGEQYYAGGADPNNREPLWDNYNTGTELYRLLGIANNLRTSKSIWNYDIIQRYSDDNFYAFTRGDVLACFTNTNSLTRYITYHSFSDGDKLCNVLYYDDCVTVSGGSITINMGDYPKVYVKQ